jgi:glucose-6-phosphate 1-dehydrogenase
MRGDAMLFVREDAVEAAWAIVDPISREYNNPGGIRTRLMETSCGGPSR